MFKDKFLRQVLYGSHESLESTSGAGSRSYLITFPAKEDGDIVRQMRFAADDGLILYFLKRIEKLEEKVAKLKTLNK